MKKILTILTAALMAISFAACNGCKGDDKTFGQVDASNDFNVLMLEIHKMVSAEYTDYAFYEASAKLNSVDSLAAKGLIEPTTMTLAYGGINDKSSLLVTVDSAFNVKVEKVGSPWLEDFYMTPFVPMHLTTACKLLQDSVEISLVPGMPVVLRHQVWYREPEPRYFIGTIAKCHTVNVYSGEIDQRLAQPEKEYLDACGITEEEAAMVGELVAKYEQEDSALTVELENKSDSTSEK